MGVGDFPPALDDTTLSDRLITWMRITPPTSAQARVLWIGGNATILASGEDPSWAPNSRTVIFTKRLKGGRRVLSLLDVPTKRYKDIPPVAGSCSQPSWAK